MYDAHLGDQHAARKHTGDHAATSGRPLGIAPCRPRPVVWPRTGHAHGQPGRRDVGERRRGARHGWKAVPPGADVPADVRALLGASAVRVDRLGDGGVSTDRRLSFGAHFLRRHDGGDQHGVGDEENADARPGAAESRYQRTGELQQCEQS